MNGSHEGAVFYLGRRVSYLPEDFQMRTFLAESSKFGVTLDELNLQRTLSEMDKWQHVLQRYLGELAQEFEQPVNPRRPPWRSSYELDWNMEMHENVSHAIREINGIAQEVETAFIESPRIDELVGLA